jgi:hypothetical protein
MGEFSGYDIMVATGSGSSPEVENKTNKKENKSDTGESKFQKESSQIVEQTGEKNVLNGFRSVTYNFTLAGLNKEYLKDPKKLRESELDLVILKSGGKGTDGIALTSSFLTSGITTPSTTAGGGRGSGYVNRNYAAEFLDKFNSESPGRFDFFIDNVEIESVMSFSKESNLSLPTKIKFDVVEPYSMNGFIEALYVASLAAGYPSYLQASFVLKIEFWGYPDDDTDEFKDPIKIPNAERYFPIGLTNIEVDVSEKGTRYRVDAVPYNERAFGQPNTVKKPIKMEGQTVKEILENFMKSINDQTLKEHKDSRKDGNATQVDFYSIKFPVWDEVKGWSYDSENKISKEKLVELMKDNALYGLTDPSSTDKPNAYKTNGSKQPTAQEQAKKPESIKYNPSKTVVQFGEGMNIHEVITAVIRDSEYTRNILKDIKKHIDAYGMIEYFTVRIEVENTDIINTETKKPVQKINYIVSPYKVHYTKIPNLADNFIEEKELKKLSRREYNYIYTGQNVDVMAFKLNFNTLFFEAVPSGLGNKDSVEAKTAAGNDNNVKTSQASPSNEDASKLQVPMHPKKVVTTQLQSYGGNASQPLDDPYSILARNMHNAVVNSQASMLTGELEILGDPFYLVTGGMGSYNPAPVGNGSLKGGEAAFNQGQLMITINFRNPIDIMPFEQGGMMFFDANRIPFSGVYMVTQATHTFKDGAFKQRLNVIRVPGQILDYSVKATDPSMYLTATPDPEDGVKEDTSTAKSPSQRLDTNLYEQLDRGIPSPGLPNQLSNFTNSPGGLGGAVPSLLNQTMGLVSRGNSIIGNPLPTDMLSNVRLNSSGLTALGQNNLGTAAMLAVAANVVTGNVPIKRAVGVLAGAAAGTAIASLLKKSNQGSGIGEGATVSIPKVSSLPVDPTAQDIQYGNTINSAALPVGSISDSLGTLKSLGTNAVDTVVGLGKKAGEYASGIGDKVKSLSGTPADPAALGAALGLSASALSGLSPNLSSKSLDQVKNMISKAPADVNLSQAVDSGVVLDYIPSAKISNLPATSPYSVAPSPNLSAVKEFAAQSNPLSGFTGRLNNIDTNISADKILTARSQIANVTGQSLIPGQGLVDSVTGKFGSVSAGNSPLDKLINRNTLG